jgi:hypothetical protein
MKWASFSKGRRATWPRRHRRHKKDRGAIQFRTEGWTVRKNDFLMKLGLVSIAGAWAFLRGAKVADAAQSDEDALVGLWDMTITAGGVKYHYVYSISRGAWVGTGDTDEGYQGTKLSPTMGAYVRAADGSYRYAEQGWVFDLKGNNVGSFRSAGTFKLNATQTAFTGPGTVTQFDLHRKTVATDHFAVTATKVAV